MTQEQETRLKEICDIQFLYDILLQTIAERDEARQAAEGMADSHAVCDAPDAESVPYRLEMRRKRNPLPWETKDV